MKKIFLMFVFISINCYCQTAIEYNNIGYKKFISKDYSGAIKNYNLSIKLNPKYATVYSNRGLARAKSGDSLGAIEDFNKALSLSPNLVVALSNRGNYKSDLKDYIGAIEDYDKVIKLEKNNSGIYNDRGFAKSMLKDYEGALIDYDKAIKLNQKYGTAYYNRGVSKYKLGLKESGCIDFDLANKYGMPIAKRTIEEFCNSNLQTNQDNEELFSKDGKLLGKKKDLVKVCINDFFNETKIVLREDSETYNNKKKLCECTLTTISKHLNFEEIISLVNKKLDIQKMAYEKGNENLLEDFKNCSGLLLNSVDADFDISKIDGAFGDNFLLGCESKMNESYNADTDVIDSHLYCECLKNETSIRGLKMSLKDLKDENSVVFNEIIVNCLNKPGVLKNKENETNENDVLGNSNIEYLPIVNINELNKVKISFGNISKYFIIDSGASNMTISSNLEKELFLEGVLKKENYLEDEKFNIADGTIITCKMILLNNINIGGFVVNNVKIAVVKNDNSSLLLGKSVLNKFKKWYIDNQNSLLYLEKENTVSDFESTIDYYNNGISKYIAKDYSGSIKDFDIAISIKPKESNYYYYRGLAKKMLKNNLSAIVDFDTAIELSPNSYSFYFNRGLSNLEINKFNESIIDFNVVIQNDTNIKDAYYCRGVARVHLKDYKKAIKDFDSAILLNLKDSYSYYLRGLSKLYLDDKVGACLDFSKALEFGYDDSDNFIKNECK
jgi:tetratricopeptide (TPR) repeat protein